MVPNAVDPRRDRHLQILPSLGVHRHESLGRVMHRADGPGYVDNSLVRALRLRQWWIARLPLDEGEHLAAGRRPDDLGSEGETDALEVPQKGVHIGA